MFYENMGIINNYIDYRKNKPFYKEWENKNTQEEAKRINYLKKNNINAANSKEDIERAKTVLGAVDIIDEYSQSRAEEMEMTVQGFKTAAMRLASGASLLFAGLSIALSQKVSNAIINLKQSGGKLKLSPYLLVPVVIAAIPVIATAVITSIFGAKQETKASRLGRAEAINKKLSSENNFAILTDEQKKKVEEYEKNINISKKEAKKLNKVTSGFGVINALKTLIKGDKESEKKLKELQEKAKKDFENVNSDKVLTEEQILEAKKDKQLVQNIVKKIDIASQEYAEDVELATDTFSVLALGTGGAIGGLTKLILSKIKSIPEGKSSLITSIVIAATTLIGAVWAASLQKEASRVGRFKVKQDLLSNPEKLIYVDDEKIKNEPDVDIKQKKKPNFLKFLLQASKDNKKYKKYVKEHNISQLKHSQALEKIELTPEQSKRAKQLQNNVFKMFNKVDEKSQTYAESTEALGEIVANTGGLIPMTLGMLGYAKFINKSNFIGAAISLIAGAIPSILLNTFVTKEQIKASKVANMLAVNEMDDYKNFADYSENVVSNKDIFKNNETKKDNSSSKNTDVNNISQQDRIVAEILKNRK